MPTNTTMNPLDDAKRWISGEISLGRFIYNSGLESRYAQASDFAGGIANAFEEKLANAEKDQKRLLFLRSKGKYARPVQGYHNGAWQITITFPPGETVPSDFFAALDKEMYGSQ